MQNQVRISCDWEFDESRKSFTIRCQARVEDQVVFMALDDNNGNHFTTEDNMDTRQTIVFM